jgi:two-component system chemotaxis response regulator CheY
MSNRVLANSSDGRLRPSAFGKARRQTETATASPNKSGPVATIDGAATHPHNRSVARAVLVVEDDGDAREMLAIVLADAGFQVRTAADGRAGLDVAASQHVDLVITDLAMPRMDGIQMLLQLRQRAETRDIPVIVVTGQAVADFPARAHAAGCTAVLSKPCCPDYLVSVINHYIDLKQDNGN